MIKKAAVALAAIATLALIYLVGSGFQKNTSVYIDSFSISADGSEITLNVGIASSAGYVRKAAVYQQHGGKLYVDFYSAFGGINGSVGAKTSFTLPLDEDTELIAVYRNTNCYEEALYKDGGGTWHMK